jgi:subtilisin-like proprotein convertase family protein
MIPLLLAALVEMRLDYTRVSLTKTVRHYTQLVDGIEVAGGERIEENGKVTFDSVAPAILPARSSRSQASIAGRIAGATPAYVNVDGTLRPALRVIEFPRPLEPHARWYDTETGALLRDQPLFHSIRARVFDVNPVAKLNEPSLRDQNNIAAAVPDAAYSIVDLPDLAPGATLAGPNAQIVDIEAPFTAHANPSQPLDALDRGRVEFEEVNAYFQIDRAQRYLQSLGYVGPRRLIDYSLPIDAHAANGTDNSYFIESNPPGRGALYFGDGGTDDAEDSDIMLHEFAHAMHNWIAPGALSGGSGSQSSAIAEGLGDYWSFSSTYDATRASGRDPACIADWDARCAGDSDSEQCAYPAGADCLRRVDSTKTITDYRNANDPGTEHENGEIWSSALRDIFLAIGKENSDRVVIESLFGLPPSPSFRDLAQRMVEADRALRGGADVPVICTAMTSRGIFGAGECGTPMRGEYTSHPAPISVTPIPDDATPLTSSISIGDARAIVSIGVRVDIRHARRGDLAITLVAPDGTEFLLKQTSDSDRTPDVHATFGLDAAPITSLAPLKGRSAAGTWTLVVTDRFAGDTGALESWSLLLQLTGDAAFESRPQLAVRKVIPAAGHVTGVLGRQYVTDVYLFSARNATLTLLFTPTGTDGTTNFSAMRVGIEGGSVVRLEDVVAQLGTTGLGQLEVASDGDFIATSRTYYRDANGTHGDRVGAVDVDDALTSLVVGRNYGVYWNLGIANVTGASGIVRVRGVDYAMLPYGHMQFGAEGTEATFEVVSGDIRIVAYASVIENDDFAVYRAQRIPLLAPPYQLATDQGGPWVLDVWEARGAIFGRYIHQGESESLPFYEVRAGEIIGVEISDAFRTNVDASGGVVQWWDAAGHLIPAGDSRVARVSVQNVPGEASVIDNRSGDGWVIPGQ